MPKIEFKDMPLKQPEPSTGGNVMYSNGFAGPFSKKDMSNPVCYQHSWPGGNGVPDKFMYEYELYLERIMAQFSTPDQEYNGDER